MRAITMLGLLLLSLVGACKSSHGGGGTSGDGDDRGRGDACTCPDGTPPTAREDCFAARCVKLDSCAGDHYCGELIGAAVDFTVQAEGGVGLAKLHSVHVRFEKDNEPDDSDGAVCSRHTQDGTMVFSLFALDGPDDPQFQNGLQVRLSKFIGPATYRITAPAARDGSASYMAVSLALGESQERVRANLEQTGSCTVMVKNELEGSLECAGMSATTEPAAGGDASDLPSRYTLTGSWKCAAVLDDY